MKHTCRKQVRSDMPDQREGFTKQVRAVVPEHSEGHIKASAQRHARPARKTNKTDVCSYGYVKKKAKKSGQTWEKACPVSDGF